MLPVPHPETERCYLGNAKRNSPRQGLGREGHSKRGATRRTLLILVALIVVSGLGTVAAIAGRDGRVADGKGVDLGRIPDGAERALLKWRIEGRSDEAELNDVLAGLASVGVPKDPASKRDAARSWGSAASLIRESEGDTPLFFEAVATAAALDPSDAALAAEAERQRRRQAMIDERLRKAAQARADRANADAERK